MMALVLESYPDKKLETDEVGAARKLVMGRILALPGDAPAATSWERDGALIFCCANQSSADCSAKKPVRRDEVRRDSAACTAGR